MAKTATINARIEPEEKERAESIFAAIGVSASEAISMFYRQVTFRRGLPFDVCVPNATTIAALGAAAGRLCMAQLVNSLTNSTSYTIIGAHEAAPTRWPTQKGHPRL
jgi:DNA-damage-inducible protein J